MKERDNGRVGWGEGANEKKPRGRADRGDLSMNDAYLMVLVPSV